MSRQSRQQLSEEKKQREPGLVQKRNFLWLFSFIVAGFVAVGTLVWVDSRPQNSGTTSTTELLPQGQPKTIIELLALSPTELDNCDIARLNLLCAEGLAHGVGIGGNYW